MTFLTRLLRQSRASRRLAGRDLAIHIGDFKTGSTSIQHVLSNALALSDTQRLFWPGAVDHRVLAQTLGDPRFVPEYHSRWQALAADMAAAPDWDTAVISSEQFEFIAPDKLNAALNTYLPDLAETARVIVYIRPHGSRFLASCAEHLKQGFTIGPLTERYDWFQAQKSLFYVDRLARWRAVFGTRLTVRPMVREALHDGDVVTDFLHWLLEGAPYNYTPVPQQNTALCLQDLTLMRTIHLHLIARGGMAAARRHAAGWQIARYLSRCPPAAPQALRLHETLAARLVEDYSADAATLDKEVFRHPYFTPALADIRARACPAPQSLEAADWHDPQTLRLTECWANMLGEVLERHPDAFLSALEAGAASD